MARFTVSDLDGGDPLHEGVAAANSAGVLGVMYREKFGGHGPLIDLEQYRDVAIRPMIEQLVAALHEAEGHGRAQWRLNILPPTRALMAGHVGTLSTWLAVASEMVIPANRDDIRELPEAWIRECMRAAGRPEWER
jgi:hypothetical protein